MHVKDEARRTSSSKAKWIGVWSVCSWKYRGSDTVQSTHFKTPIATTGNLKKGSQSDFSNSWTLSEVFGAFEVFRLL